MKSIKRKKSKARTLAEKAKNYQRTKDSESRQSHKPDHIKNRKIQKLIRLAGPNALSRLNLSSDQIIGIDPLSRHQIDSLKLLANG